MSLSQITSLTITLIFQQYIVRKASIIFLTISLIKGTLMIINIFTVASLPTFPLLLRFLILFILYWFIDQITLSKINGQMNKITWLKSTLFLSGTYVSIFITTGLFFFIYRSIQGTKLKPTSGPIILFLIVILVFGLVLICINVALYLKRQKRTAPNNALQKVELTKFTTKYPSEFSNTNKQKVDIGRFIGETLKNTISASRSRLVIFCIILFLQFSAVEMITSLSQYYYPDTYDGLTKKIANESALTAFIELTKYVLLLILLIRSPAEPTGKRRLFKYIVLLGSLYFWAITDLMFQVYHADDNKQELAAKSFKENAIPVYGQVVFASYKRNESYYKRSVAIAEKLSEETDGYIVIVQLDGSLYSYPGLKNICHRFNDYTHVTHDVTFRTNIDEKVPDISTCLQFNFDFSIPLRRIPELPAVGKYVKIIYDPIENHIAMYTDSATVATPTFDSIPPFNGQHDREHGNKEAWAAY